MKHTKRVVSIAITVALLLLLSYFALDNIYAARTTADYLEMVSDLGELRTREDVEQFINSKGYLRCSEPETLLNTRSANDQLECRTPSYFEFFNHGGHWYLELTGLVIQTHYSTLFSFSGDELSEVSTRSVVNAF